jgi:hypothetical protein
VAQGGAAGADGLDALAQGATASVGFDPDDDLIGHGKFQAPSTKHQISNKQQVSNGRKPNDGQNFGPAVGVCRLVPWTLSFVCDLTLVIWNLAIPGTRVKDR